MPVPLISGALCQLNILPLNASNQVCQNFAPVASEIVLTDDTAETYTIESLTWTPTTGVGLLTFIAPYTSVSENRTLSMTLDGRPILISPSPLIITVMPAFGGKSVLTNAWLAWDMGIPNATTTQLGDYSGNNNYAVCTNGWYFPAAVMTAATAMWLSPTVSTPIGRAVFSLSTGNYNTSTAPTLNSPSMAAGSFTNGIPFRTISTGFIDAAYFSEYAELILWTYAFTDANGMTRSLSLGISSESSFGGQTIQVNSSYNGTNYPSVINVGCGAYLSKADAFALFTLVLNSDGSATLYASGTVLATVANIWGPGVPIPPMTGNCTLTQFSGMGTSSWASAYNQTFGQLELIAYTDAKPAAFVYTNAYAWGLV